MKEDWPTKKSLGGSFRLGTQQVKCLFYSQDQSTPSVVQLHHNPYIMFVFPENSPLCFTSICGSNAGLASVTDLIHGLWPPIV